METPEREPRSGEPRLRRATPDDAPAIRELVDAAYGHYVQRIGRLPRPMVADHAAAIRDHDVFVLDDGCEIAGVLDLIPAPDHLYVENVAVRPSRQGEGLGRRLLDHAESEARLRGLPEIRLVTNVRFSENRAIYARRGFEEVGLVPTETTPIVELRKRLDPPAT
jgi:N-acetylglutamate synthase-like GNAT family acetyltransferase